MTLKRTPRTGAASMTLAVSAVIVLTMATHRVCAQAKAETSNRAAGQADGQARTDAKAVRDRETTQPGTRGTKGSVMPEPTVALEDGEVPDIKFESPVFDFGRVRAGTPVKHDFVFTNTGNGTLEILNAKAG